MDPVADICPVISIQLVVCMRIHIHLAWLLSIVLNWIWMQERLSIRRDRFREGLRKEHNQTILKKKRIEINEAIEAREDPIM